MTRRVYYSIINFLENSIELEQPEYVELELPVGCTEKKVASELNAYLKERGETRPFTIYG